MMVPFLVQEFSLGGGIVFLDDVMHVYAEVICPQVDYYGGGGGLCHGGGGVPMMRLLSRGRLERDVPPLVHIM